jgi:hypothetical protein
MASASNLSVPHSRNNPAPTLFDLGLPGRGTIARRQESLAARATSLRLFTAGLLLGFAGAYLVHSPLTVGQITIVAAFGPLLLAKGLSRRVRIQ